MVRSRISENESLKKAFRDTYAAKEREETGDGWQLQVMRRIRQIGPLRPAAGFWPAFESMVWTLAPVSCLLVLVLTLFFVNMELDVDSDYLGTMAAEMEQPTLVELFGLEG
jgi:hypothetical protein